MPFIALGCVVLIALFALSGVMMAVGIAPKPAPAPTPTTPGVAVVVTTGCTMSDRVPKNFALVFCEAQEKTNVPAPMIAGLYLTEHHTNSFGKDIKDIDSSKGSCSSNSSGAAGPMQFIPSSWNGIADNLQRAGIAHPNRCKYRDSIIGAGFLLKGKATFRQVAAVCKKDKNHDYIMTDECISWWGQSYCGLGSGVHNGIPGCGNHNCSTRKYFYCVEIVKKYHLTKG